jgi:hypothetical protein
LVAVGLGLFAVGCEKSTPSEPQPPRPIPTASIAPASTIDSITFESYSVGPLSTPWSGGSAGSSSVSIVNTPKHGKVLLQNAGKATGDYLSYSTPFSPVSTNLTVEFDVKPGSGASPTFILHGSGYGASKNQLRLQRIPGSNAVIVGTLNGPNCGNLTNEAWNHVVLTVTSTAPRTFTVTINGARTAACTGASTTFTPPYKAIGIFDPSNAGFGGTTTWDNFYIHN